MRDLTVMEIEIVSGAGWWADLFSGAAETVNTWINNIGSTVRDAIQTWVNGTPNVTAAQGALIREAFTRGYNVQLQQQANGFSLGVTTTGGNVTSFTATAGGGSMSMTMTQNGSAIP